MIQLTDEEIVQFVYDTGSKIIKTRYGEGATMEEPESKATIMEIINVIRENKCPHKTQPTADDLWIVALIETLLKYS